jgi:hypothetical protein
MLLKLTTESLKSAPFVKAVNKNKVIVKFIKDNGEERLATVTRNMVLMGTNKTKPPVDPTDLITVWDLEKDDWIRIRLSKIQLWAEIKFSR